MWKGIALLSWGWLIAGATLSPLWGQVQLKQRETPEARSLHQTARYYDAGDQVLDVDDIMAAQAELPFQPFSKESPSLGFTDHHVWVACQVENLSAVSHRMFLETGRPITDYIDVYVMGSDGTREVWHGGDAVPLSQRQVAHRRNLFPLQLQPHTRYDLYLHFKSDGEVIDLPLVLRSDLALVQATSSTQFGFGLFYGILLLAVITYLFFYLALGDLSFLYYCLYVVSGAMLQLSLDGYVYEQLAPGAGWLGRHAVILSALFSTLFLARYASEFLQLKRHERRLYQVFWGLQGAAGLQIGLICIWPSFLVYSYPLANALGLLVLMTVLGTLLRYYLKGHPSDHFFSAGLSVLMLSFVIFILNNFSLLPNSFLTEHIVKVGTGLELVCLSLSMGNRIRLLKSEKEKLSTLALKRSEEMSELKSYYLSNMSHELRTPLNAIMGLATMTIKETEDVQIRRNCEVIKYSSVGLLSAVNDILDFSKIEKNELCLEEVPFTLTEVIESIVHNAAAQATERKLTFDFTPSGSLGQHLLGDPTRLGQILNNLLGNAIKFTMEGGVVFTLDVQPDGADQAWVSLSVIDTGVGIAPEKLEDIFDPLTQGNITHKRQFGGFGLGLFIVRSLVNLHQGEIHVQSTPGIGTTCTVRLPYALAPAAPVEATAYPTDRYDLLGSTILLVEDNPVNQMVIRAMLRKWAHTDLLVANHGEEALAKLATSSVDLILMDLQMPVMDGYEATEAIRRGDAGTDHAQVPIIALTADVMEESRERALALGMNGYQTKPVDVELLYRNITSALTDAKHQPHDANQVRASNLSQ
jgi:signal transduction histidine kinase/CheY-like chemotaxis protein